MARAQGARAQMALAFESVYGTPPPAGDYFKIPFTSSNLGSEQQLLASDVLGLGRDPAAPVADAINADGDVGIPLDLRALGIWLKALFGGPVSTGTGPYVHTYQSGAWTLPSFAVEVGNPDVPSFRMMSGCVANSFALTMARSGLIGATVNVISQGEAPTSVSAAGALTEMAFQRFGAFQGQVKRNGVSLGSVTGAQLTYSNNLDRVETIRADGKIDGADPGIASLTGSIDVRFADTVLLDQAVSGLPCEMEFGYTIGASASLKFVAHDVYLPRPKLPLTGPAGVQATFNWQAAKDLGVGRMLTVTLTNDVADYNNP